MAQKLVVVDDQPVFRQVMQDVLGAHFDIVALPETLEEVWEAVRTHEPAAIIIDINLDGRFQGRDGLRIARELVASHPDLKIVLVSGFTENAYESLARTIPGAVFMEKAALSGDRLLALLKSAGE